MAVQAPVLAAVRSGGHGSHTARGECFDFTMGKCRRGAACKFGHKVDSLNVPMAVPGSNVCIDFLNGRCARPNCRFDHELPGAAPNANGVCFDFQEGRCRRGASCKFEHTHAVDPARREVCLDWEKNGWCQRGRECRFYHTGRDEPPQRGYNRSPPRNSYEPQACADFRLGRCLLGNSCRFEHPGASVMGGSDRWQQSAAPRHAPARSVCTDFQMGRCLLGNACRFEHPGGAASWTPPSRYSDRVDDLPSL